eukprot:gnl/TRDRNA2_/TRDRNA2_153394_c1_seq1.p1 gnl/TRDRNA2_/TRDRNA2_153394_c1~~gnl/TRDRNA2_/TRDRNA2_153394_c1_seq1.p1  ORF type:complete len:384 (-),score=70.90 gnl/TRDRNA2_/TRDRNA2_153394_c1_seq1:83-1234(-)
MFNFSRDKTEQQAPAGGAAAGAAAAPAQPQEDEEEPLIKTASYTTTGLAEKVRHAKNKALKNEPMMARANKILTSSQSAARNAALQGKEKTVATGLLILVPFLTYTITLYFTVVVYHFMPDTTMYTVCFIMLCSIFMYIMPTKRYMQVTGLFMMLAVVIAVSVATYVYYNKFIYFFRYGDMMKYTNVRASRDPEAVADAGMLLFSSDSSVDGARSVGFAYAQAHTTLCVAPIVDGSMGLNSEISFFAVGQNCCAARAHFECGDVSDGSARSGLMVLDPGTLSWPSTGPLVEFFSEFPRDGYMEAIDLQKAYFGSRVNKNMRFVWWTGHPMADREQYWKKGERIAQTSIIIYGIFSLCMGIYQGTFNLIQVKRENQVPAHDVQA